MASAYFDPHPFELAAAQAELAEFGELLGAYEDLGERRHVLANFSRWRQLCSLFGTYHPTLGAADLVRREFRVGAHFIADLCVRRAGTDRVCLVEFEGARKNDIFAASRAGRRVDPWGAAMEKGYSQVIDWAWALDTYRDAPDFQDAFGSRRPSAMGVLVVGRSTSLSDATRRDRWNWRSRWATPPGLQGLQLCTYDDVYDYFDIQIALRAGRTAPVPTEGSG